MKKIVLILLSLIVTSCVYIDVIDCASNEVKVSVKDYEFEGTYLEHGLLFYKDLRIECLVQNCTSHSINGVEVSFMFYDMYGNPLRDENGRYGNIVRINKRIYIGPYDYPHKVLFYTNFFNRRIANIEIVNIDYY